MNLWGEFNNRVVIQNLQTLQVEIKKLWSLKWISNIHSLTVKKKRRKKRRHFLTFSSCLNGINAPFTASEGTKETTTHCYKLWKLSNTKILNHISSCNPKPSPKKGKRKMGKLIKTKGNKANSNSRKNKNLNLGVSSNPNFQKAWITRCSIALWV